MDICGFPTERISVTFSSEKIMWQISIVVGSLIFETCRYLKSITE